MIVFLYTLPVKPFDSFADNLSQYGVELVGDDVDVDVDVDNTRIEVLVT